MNESIKSTPNKSPKLTYNQSELNNSKLNNTLSQRQQQQVFNSSIQSGTHKKQSASLVFQNNSIEKSLIQQTFDELDYYKSRCVDQERQIQMLLNENQYQLKSQRDSMIHDNRVDSFIKENSVLQLDNEKLAKLATQKKTEAELWKQKYENQLSQVIQVKANYEQEIRQLTAENQKLIQKVDESQFDLQRQLLDHKSKIDNSNSKNFDDAKKGFNQQADILQTQMKQLREQLEDKSLEIDDLNEKLLRIKKEDDEEIKRVLKDNEMLRNRLNQFEIEKQQEFEELTSKINLFQEEQLQNFKISQSNQNLMIESEVEKLKGLLDIKNTEIQTLIVQNQKIKNAYEEDLESSRREINLLKQKLLDQEKQNRRKLEMLSTDLNRMHQEDIEQLRINYESQIIILEKEISDLKDIINKKDHEIQQQFDEKYQLQQYLENQIYSLKNEIEQNKLRYFELEKEKNREIDELQEQFMKNQSLTSENTDQQRNHIKFLEDEIIKIKEINNQRNKDLESLVQQNLLARKQLEDELRSLSLINQNLKEELLLNEQKKNNESDELKTRNNRLELQHREKIRQLEICCEHQNVEIKRLKEHLEVKGQEIDNLLVQRSSLERELRRVKDEIEQLKTKIIQQEREKLQSQDELKIKLENSSQYQIQNLKAAFNTQIQILQEENSTLKNQIEKKNTELEDLIDKADKLSRAITQGPHLGAETTTNKHLTEAYIKSKNKLSISRQQ